MTIKRKILAQGDRDGACFLYSLANATSALSQKDVTQAKWVKCIRALPFDMSDFIAGRGTEKLDPCSLYLESFSHSFMSALNISPEISWKENITSVKKLKNLINSNQVFILSIDGDSHWVAVVDVEGDTVFIACSAEALNGVQPYSEKESPDLKRIYNKSVLFSELGIENGFGLLISLEKDE